MSGESILTFWEHLDSITFGDVGFSIFFNEHNTHKKGAHKTLIDSNNLKVALKV